jgi:hypothetical protein
VLRPAASKHGSPIICSNTADDSVFTSVSAQLFGLMENMAPAAAMKSPMIAS